MAFVGKSKIVRSWLELPTFVEHLNTTLGFF
jgi:hypothetical protein